MSLPWYPRYPRNMLASAFVASLSLKEVGIYNILLDYAWLDDHCSIPSDRAQIANLVRGDTGPAVERVLEKWIKSPDVPERLINETIYGHWEKANEKVEKARRAVRIRWERHRAPAKERKPQGPTTEEFGKVDEMVEIWNARAHPMLPRAHYAAQAAAQGKAIATRIRANPWLYEKFEHIVNAAMQRYCAGPDSMLGGGRIKWLKFSWFATGPLIKIEALRDFQTPTAPEGAPTRL